jgi:hypothetical protein
MVRMASRIVREVDPNVGNMLDGLPRIEHENRQVLGKLFGLGTKSMRADPNIEKLGENRADVNHMGKPR